MASKTDIANRALSKLGSSRVSNVDTDNNTPAKTISYMWDSVRDAMLTAFPWNFAIKRVQIAADATAPSWGYNNSYTLPSDFLALIEIKDMPDYRIEGGKILTNQRAPLYIKYIYRVEETGLYDSLFNEALATRLAYEACEQITQSNTKKQILAQEFRERISEAYASDSIQDLPVERPDDTWLLARESYTDEIDYNAQV